MALTEMKKMEGNQKPIRIAGIGSWHIQFMTIKHLDSAFPCLQALLHISNGKYL